MAGYGGQERAPGEIRYPVLGLSPGYSSETFTANSHGWELPPMAQEACLLSSNLRPVTVREQELMQELKESRAREAALSNSLDCITRRLCYNMHQGKEKEAQIAQWKSLYSEALASFQENEEELRIKQMEQEGAVGAQVNSELQFQLGAKQTAIEELVAVILQRDLTIIALEVDQKVFQDELRRVINGSIKILWEVAEQVLDLTADLQEFQRRNDSNTTAPRRARQELPTTGTLLECSVEVTNMIRDAQSALAGAGKFWKRAESELEVMEAYNRERLMARVLGKKEPRISDIGKAMSSELNQVE